MTRRIQSLALIVALLAVPFALLSRSYTCMPGQCSMMCCRHAHGHDMNMKCHSGPTGMCMLQCQSQNPVYRLICPFPPTQLQVAFKLPPPRPGQSFFFVDSPRVIHGFSLIPFEPPRL